MLAYLCSARALLYIFLEYRGDEQLTFQGHLVALSVMHVAVTPFSQGNSPNKFPKSGLVKVLAGLIHLSCMETDRDRSWASTCSAVKCIVKTGLCHDIMAWLQ
jgi:hypothetical protein